MTDNPRSVRIGRGLLENLPKVVPYGELLYTKDTKELWVGNEEDKPQKLTFNKKTIVFVMPGLIEDGPYPIEIRFPHQGEILGVSASCRVPGPSPCVLNIQKIERQNYNNNIDWNDVLTGNIALPTGNRISDQADVNTDQAIVSKDDYFRVYVISSGGARDVTVNVDIRISN